MIQPPKLLDQVRSTLRLKHYNYSTEKTYIHWIRGFIFFHNKRHPQDMAEDEIRQYLTYLAVKQRVTASTQNQALNAIVFLYKRVLSKDLGDFSQAVRARRARRRPTVLTVKEIDLLFRCLPDSQHGLIVQLLYGAGLRIRECVGLRVQDIDFTASTITIRAGKGDKDRITVLPDSVQPGLKRHLKRVEFQFQQDLADGFADIYLPHAIARKYPKAAKQWRWQFVFPADYPSKDPRTGIVRRHHIYPGSINRCIQKATNLANITKRVTAHAMRHTFATHLLESETNIRVVQELLGHRSIETTKIYLHCLNTPGETVASPLDALGLEP